MGNPADSVEPSVATGLPHGRLVLVACSGGADSVALLTACVRTAVTCAAGHVDHGLRPESAAEAERVRELARRLDVPFHLERIERLDLKASGLEASAREARYRALADLALRAGAPIVATAHTRRDQAETVLLRLIRGAGPGALAGIRRQRELAPGIQLLRPLLEVSRAATEEYCRRHGLAFTDDPHNSDPARARGRLRALWPQLLALNPRLEEALARAARTFAEEDELLDELSVAGARLHPALQRRALLREAREQGARPERRHLEAILRLLERGEGSIDVPGGRAVVRFEGRRPPARPAEEVAIAAPGRYFWQSRALEVSEAPGPGVQVDVQEAPFPWKLRGHQPGDRFRPAGGRAKKVADLWIDAHIPREERTRLALLADARGRVFWVEGIRAGAACGRGPVRFRLEAEMKPSDGPLPSRRRHESRSATMDPRPDEEPR
ncbi:MAG TPA: tRNA lysidine(34) synthetase TilS [Myxococcales bacterium]|nr:tRNA lysidine(34) synthetase TilS [Myxococcales bacterium]